MRGPRNLIGGTAEPVVEKAASSFDAARLRRSSADLARRPLAPETNKIADTSTKQEFDR
jgi:hypothetical protein